VQVRAFLRELLKLGLEFIQRSLTVLWMGEDASIIVGPVKERIRSFQRKHGCNLETFEDRLKQLPEDFERWDDFISGRPTQTA
jgi:hypothetical protein